MKVSAGSLWTFGLVVLMALAVGACSKNGGSTTTTAPPAKELDSKDVLPGGQYTHQFMTAGSFNYHCIYHNPMVGTVTVNNSAPDSILDVQMPNSSSPFPAAAVKVKGVITWHNNTGATHTVTSN